MAMKPLYWTRIQLKTPKIEKLPNSPSKQENEVSEERENESKGVEVKEKEEEKKENCEVGGESKANSPTKRKKKKILKR